MFDINDKDIKDLENKLRLMNERALPFATRQTLNDAAFAAMKIAKADLPQKMILKNKFTQQSIRVQKSKTLDIRRQTASVGSTQGYMERQEFGGTQKAGGKHGKPIATSEAAGQGDTVPRTRVVRKRNRMNNLKLSPAARRARHLSRKNRVAATIAGALAANQREIYLVLRNGTKGIFRLKGAKKNARLRMLHDLSEKSVRTPANPWLRPAFDEAVRMLPAFYADALRFQLKRL